MNLIKDSRWNTSWCVDQFFKIKICLMSSFTVNISDLICIQLKSKVIWNETKDAIVVKGYQLAFY